MKKLEVKAMLGDNERIPDEYKIGGRLSSEFLDGVDYAEQRIMESGVEVWLARDGDTAFEALYKAVQSYFWSKNVLNKKDRQNE
jgi:phosphoribosyl-ATP pyrophosphohydrolase